MVLKIFLVDLYTHLKPKFKKNTGITFSEYQFVDRELGKLSDYRMSDY
jgi:hypothetical protein